MTSYFHNGATLALYSASKFLFYIKTKIPYFSTYQNNKTE